ncbi:hypothetical protein J437_LFUL005951, partial [Ladona fulva]
MNALNSSCRFCRTFQICMFRKFSDKTEKVLHKLLMEMAKDKESTINLQRQRQKMKEKTSKYTPGAVTLQVLGSGAKGSPRSLYVFTDQSRYLFNCGEGTQRLAHEHKMKLSKLEHIFITYPCWENIGGLPGVALTIQDVGVPEITIHGPKGTADIFMATRRFVVLKNLNVKYRSPSSGVFEDPVMKVFYIPIVPLNRQKVAGESQGLSTLCTSVEEDDEDVDYYAYEANANHNNCKTKRKNRLKTDRDMEPMSDCSICYFCRLHPKQGTLILEKCVEYGVPPGPLLGKLKSGQDVTLPNGVVVKSSDVCSSPDPGPVFLVIDCPNADFIDGLRHNEELKKLIEEMENKDDIMAVVHFCPLEVLSDAQYLEWASQFPVSTTHISIGEGNVCSGSIAVHRLQYKLNLLHPKIFPLLADSGIPSIVNDEKVGIKDSKVLPNMSNYSSVENNQIDGLGKIVIPSQLNTPEKCIIKACTFFNVHLRPRKGFDSSSALQLNCQEFVDETMTVDGFEKSLHDFKVKLQTSQPSNDTYPKILFLGTGSCIPNKARNTSGILIELSERQCMLLDCGEGTYGQIVRFFGREKSDDVLLRLYCVFISHLHADHHIGLISLLKRRYSLSQKKGLSSNILYLLAPRQIMFWLNFYHDHFEPILNQVKLIPCSEVVDQSVVSFSEPPPVSASGMTSALGLKSVLTVPVCHCPNSFGVALAHIDGWKITYSGDTMPCKDLVKL